MQTVVVVIVVTAPEVERLVVGALQVVVAAKAASPAQEANANPASAAAARRIGCLEDPYVGGRTLMQRRRTDWTAPSRDFTAPLAVSSGGARQVPRKGGEAP